MIVVFVVCIIVSLRGDAEKSTIDNHQLDTQLKGAVLLYSDLFVEKALLMVR